MINQRYKIKKEIAKGTFSTLFTGIDVKTKEKVAIKTLTNVDPVSFANEKKIFLALSNQSHFPKLHWAGKHEKDYCIVSQLLGSSLKILFKKNKLTLNGICKIGLDIMTALETMHKLTYIHRDIKPDNILSGLDAEDCFYLIDFGLSRNYLHSPTNIHYPLKEENNFQGNLVFCSHNTLSGLSASRRDDVESLSLLIIYLIKR